ncbi:MAG: hypothetical protein D6780_06075 [Candidatus Dadabacteria bacterium]|nr:MAG: hypothetical protein D6780_06075 [Candidatus Dadabacteria bacterium]
MKQVFREKLEENNLALTFSKITPVSIDYGVLEKEKDVLVVKAGEFNWSDVGSWDVWAEFYKKDLSNNVSQGKVVAINCQDSAFFSQGRVIGAVGLKDIIVVETEDAVLVCSREQAQRVKEIVEHLKKEGKEKLL